MSWIRREKLKKNRILKDLNKLTKDQLYTLIHMALWDMHDCCGKGCAAPQIREAMEYKFEQYNYYDSIHE